MSWGLSLCQQTQTKTSQERERGRGTLAKLAFYYSVPLCLPGSTYLITDVTRKTWGSSNATNPSSPPPSTTNTTATTPSAPSRNRNLTTQHAVQISSGLEITEHLLASVELSAGACQCSGPASWWLMSPQFPFQAG